MSFNANDFTPDIPIQNSANNFDASDFTPENTPGSLANSGKTLLNDSRGAIGGFLQGAGNVIKNAASYAFLPPQVRENSAIANTPIQSLIPTIGNQRQYSPTVFDYSNIAGGAAPLLASPELDVAGGLTDLGGAALKKIAESYPGKLLSNSVNSSVLSGVTAPLYNMNTPLSQSVPQSMATGAEAGFAIPFASSLLTGGGGIIGRSAKVLTADADAAQAAASQDYNQFHNDANALGIRIQPNSYQQGLVDQMNKIKNGNPNALNSDLYKDLKDKLDASQITSATNPNSFTTADTHLQIQNLRDNASNAPNKTASKVYSDLAKNLNDDYLNALPDEMKKGWQNIQANYGKNVIPLTENPTSPMGAARQAAIWGGIGMLPHAISVPLAVGLGVHSANSPIVNAIKRYASPFNGGPLSTFKNTTPSPLMQSLYNSLTASYAGNQNQ